MNEVSEKKGLSGPTLAKISNLPGYNTNTDTISALCDYFEIEPFTITRIMQHIHWNLLFIVNGASFR